MLNWQDVQTAEHPFFHIQVNNFLKPKLINRINDQWPVKWEKQENGRFSKKFGSRKIPPAVRQVVDAIHGNLEPIEELTGINGLIPDPDLFGAGCHCIPPGGFLKMHVDFNKHTHGWHRRVNMLIYVNSDWDESWGGALILAKDPKQLNNDVKVIPPHAGCCVIFPTTDQSWHGHPSPLCCPANRQRRSIAVYLYTQDPPMEKPHSTIYAK